MEKLMSITNEDLEEIRKLFGEIEKKYYENIREGLGVVAQDVLDENLKYVADELKQEKPVYEKLKEVFRVLRGNLQLVSLSSTAVNQQLLPLVHKIFNFFIDKEIV